MKRSDLSGRTVNRHLRTKIVRESGPPILAASFAILFFIGGLVLPWLYPENIGGIVAFWLIVSCVLLLLGYGIFFWRGWVTKITFQTALVSLAAIIGMSLAVEFSLLSEKTALALVLYVILICLLLGVYIVSLRLAWKGDTIPEWLAQVWNVQKLFGGSAFGDFANMAGVLSAIAWGVNNAGQGWFWLGQFAALLAALVCLSLLQRRMLEGFEWGQGYALGNLAVGAFTFLSIIGPSAETEQFLRLLGLKIPQALLLILIVLNIAFYFWAFSKLGQLAFPAFYIPLILIALMAVGTSVLLVVFQFTYAPAWLPVYASYGAIFSWLLIELFSAIQNRNNWAKVVRSILIIAGNLLLFTLVLLVTRDNIKPESFNPFHWLLFFFALAFMVLATLGGIIMAAYVVAKRHNEALADPAGPQTIELQRLPSAELRDWSPRDFD